MKNKRFETSDPNIHWEDTGIVKIYNYPDNPYLVRVYLEYRKGKNGSKAVDGLPISLNNINNGLYCIAEIFGKSNKALSEWLPREKFLKPIK